MGGRNFPFPFSSSIHIPFGTIKFIWIYALEFEVNNKHTHTHISEDEEIGYVRKINHVLSD